MAIMVTDPRNNLLSQLTAVGQQYLAGKQQERMSGLDFANKKTLIELMDRLGGQADVREFGQQKELLDLQTKAQAGLLDAAGKVRLAELEMTTGSNERVAQIGATGAERTARAGQPAPPAPGESPMSQLLAIMTMLRGPQGADGQPSNPLIVKPFSIPADVQKDTRMFMPYGFLEKVQSAGNDPAALRTVETEIASSPWNFLRGPETRKKLLGVVQSRITELDNMNAAAQSRELILGDLTGAATVRKLIE